MSYSYLERKRRRERRKNLASILLFLFLLISLFFFIYKFIGSGTEQNINPSLKEIVENSLQGTSGTYAVAVKNLKSGEASTLNPEKSFEAGSLYKLWIMAEAFKQIEEGSLKEDESLSASIADLNREFNISSDEAELSRGEINLNVSSALNQMITISHNYASLLLAKRIKLSSVSEFLKSNGFNRSQVGINGSSPRTTAGDILFFYEKLYKGELANQENSEKMITLLKNQQLNDGIPGYLPDKSKVASKTGDIGWFKHDSGIVYTEKGNYIIVVLTESSSPKGAQERIAILSKAVYDYFMK